MYLAMFVSVSFIVVRGGSGGVGGGGEWQVDRVIPIHSMRGRC